MFEIIWNICMLHLILQNNISWSWYSGPKEKNITILKFYSPMYNLWDQLTLTKSDELRAFRAYSVHIEEQHLVLFWWVRDDCGGICEIILYRTPLPNTDSIINELLEEKIRPESHSHSCHECENLPHSYVHASPFSKGNQQGVVGINGCSFCKEKRHHITGPMIINHLYI